MLLGGAALVIGFKELSKISTPTAWTVAMDNKLSVSEAKSKDYIDLRISFLQDSMGRLEKNQEFTNKLLLKIYEDRRRAAIMKEPQNVN